MGEDLEVLGLTIAPFSLQDAAIAVEIIVGRSCLSKFGNASGCCDFKWRSHIDIRQSRAEHLGCS
ncbi:MAG TPA: hypothetical protein IGS40_04070 [Trichormus sp. M33_DOE_039]|nr:hypothetical protein [Trichormus sp. M33_DOE_039]